MIDESLKNMIMVQVTVMPLLVALCATAAIYGISNVTAIETIAAVTSQICYHIMPLQCIAPTVYLSF